MEDTSLPASLLLTPQPTATTTSTSTSTATATTTTIPSSSPADQTLPNQPQVFICSWLLVKPMAPYHFVWKVSFFAFVTHMQNINIAGSKYELQKKTPDFNSRAGVFSWCEELYVQATSPSLEPATPSSPLYLASAEGATVPTEETEKKEEEEEQVEEETSSSSRMTTLVPPTNVTKDSCTVVLGGSGGPVIPV